MSEPTGPGSEDEPGEQGEDAAPLRSPGPDIESSEPNTHRTGEAEARRNREEDPPA